MSDAVGAAVELPEAVGAAVKFPEVVGASVAVVGDVVELLVAVGVPVVVEGAAEVEGAALIVGAPVKGDSVGPPTGVLVASFSGDAVGANDAGVCVNDEGARVGGVTGAGLFEGSN